MGITNRTIIKRWLLFGGWIVLSVSAYVHPLTALVRTSISNDDTSYVVLIPFISIWILFAERHKVFLNLSWDVALGSSLLSGAVCVGLATTLAEGASALRLRLSGYLLSLVLFWVAGFALLFGRAASKAGFFPLFFLLLMVPLPNFLLDHVIYLLQASSARITSAFFDLLGVPALREGFAFHLAGVDIEVAKECGGIRSSMVLLILALLVAHFCLKSFWNKALFVVCGLFTMVLKNGIRIATLTLLAMYVNPSFLTGRLHHQGGIVFFLLGLLLLYPVLLFLQRVESRMSGAAESSQISEGSVL